MLKKCNVGCKTNHKDGNGFQKVGRYRMWHDPKPPFITRSAPDRNGEMCYLAAKNDWKMRYAFEECAVLAV